MAQSYDHGEVGAFADYMNLSATDPHINFIGIGGRAAFNVHHNVQIEAEMSYDFKRGFASTFSDGVTTELVNTQGPSTDWTFGPKFMTGSGPFKPMRPARLDSSISAFPTRTLQRVSWERWAQLITAPRNSLCIQVLE